MLCTVFSDTYRSNERHQIHAALETIMPRNSPDWSRFGVYAYWSPEDHELLYVGLASDEPTRFAQHNGLVRHGGGNKLAKIDDWFSTHESLGFTVLIQAAAVQLLHWAQEIHPAYGESKVEIIERAEGQLIEIHKLAEGTWPRWNGTGGSRRGQKWSKLSASTMVNLLAARTDSLFVGRRTLRELGASREALSREAVIHTARMWTCIEQHELLEIPDRQEDVVAFIENLLNISAGHVVDDLSASDSRIRGWLERFRDPTWTPPSHSRLMDVAEKLLTSEDDRERAIAELFMPSTHHGAGVFAPEFVKAVRNILDSNYLDQVAPLRRC